MVVALVVTAVCTWQVVFSGARTALAQDSSSWVPGDATATAQAISLAPSIAGLNYAFTLATSIADYQANEGQAEAETFDGSSNPVVLSLTSTQCNGQPPVVKQSQLPQPAQAESTTGNESHEETLTAQYGNVDGGGIGAGLEEASATTQPEASALARLADFDVAGAFDISGVESTAYARQITGQLRQATSTVSIADISLGNGAVQLKGLEWEDTQETGPGGDVVKQAASFSLAGVSLRGVNLPSSVMSTLSEVVGAVNTALEGTGLDITLPVSSTNSSDGEEDISSLSIGIDQSALGQEVVGPELGDAQTVRNEIDDILEDDISCTTGNEITVADILLGVLAGGGNLNLELGGASAVSSGTAYANPFDNSLGLLRSAGGAVPNLVGGSPGTPGSPGTYVPGTPAIPGVPGTSPSSGAVPSKAALGKLTSSTRCVTTSPAGHPGCSSGGAALPVALSGLAVVLGAGVADYLRLRRYRRLAPEEVRA